MGRSSIKHPKDRVRLTFTFTIILPVHDLPPTRSADAASIQSTPCPPNSSHIFSSSVRLPPTVSSFPSQSPMSVVYGVTSLCVHPRFGGVSR